MPDVPCAPARGVSVLLVRGSDDDELRADLAENRARSDTTGVARRLADSMRGALRFWAARDSCAGAPVPNEQRVRAADGTRWRWTAYAPNGCTPGLAVRLLVVPGNPHAWPGGRRPSLFSPRAAPGVPLPPVRPKDGTAGGERPSPSAGRHPAADRTACPIDA